ncbi:MAG: formate/nitrite transporter family protein [Janthinobacterium lividum]
MTDAVTPPDIVSHMVEAARTKATLRLSDLFIRGALAGAFLGFVTSLAFLAGAQTGQFIVGALLFPAGFVLIVLLGLELLTGNFGIMPTGVLAGRVTFGQMVSNWAVVFVANLIGSLVYAGLFWIAVTDAGTNDGGALGHALRALATSKTTVYENLGAAGLLTVFVKAVLCNWMVSLGSVMGLATTSTIGKIFACWLPIVIFVAQGYEHSVVNMFAIPAGMMLGAPVSLTDWWVWNEIPVTLGNMVGGALFTGVALYLTFGRGKPVEAGAPTARP